jgi:hypothetical protein
MVEGSDVNILMAVTRVLEVQHHYVQLTAVASGTSILMVVTKVLKVQHSLCTAHSGGRRCWYPDCCRKDAVESPTMVASVAPAGGM